jgi:hypothetical protein
MARTGHTIEKYLEIVGENGAKGSGPRVLQGSAAPGGDAGDQDAAPLGSLYLRSNGSVYSKKFSTNATSDWLTVGDVTIDQLSWRNETVRAATNQSLSAGSTDPTGWSDNESLDDTDFTVGQYVLGDVDGTPALWEVTAISSPNITLAAASLPLAANDTFVVNSYLPDSGASQEVHAIVHFPSGSSAPGVKISDLNWNFADGIGMGAGYTPANGTVSSGDTVQSAIQKLDANQQDLITLSGVAQGEPDLGTFTGDIIADDSTIKAALQSLETELVDTRDNVDDLITLSGVAENAEDFGTFTGSSLADAQTAKQLFQRIETLLEQMRGVQVTGITTAATVDSVPHASVKAVKWLVEVFEEATPANRVALEVYALNNGSAVDDTAYAKLKTGSNFNLTISVDISGADMRLRAASTSAGVTVTARRIEVVKSVL